MMEPRERYHRDTQFRTMVDMMYACVVRCEYTPTELREAAVLAAILYEERHARPLIVDRAEWEQAVKRHLSRAEPKPPADSPSPPPGTAGA